MNGQYHMRAYAVIHASMCSPRLYPAAPAVLPTVALALRGIVEAGFLRLERALKVLILCLCQHVLGVPPVPIPPPVAVALQQGRLGVEGSASPASKGRSGKPHLGQRKAMAHVVCAIVPILLAAGIARDTIARRQTQANLLTDVARVEACACIFGTVVGVRPWHCQGGLGPARKENTAAQPLRKQQPPAGARDLVECD